MKKVVIVFGTRPEAIKLCPLVLELATHSDTFTTSVCVTAQHREMLDQVLSIFNVTPQYDLNIMRDDQTLFDSTSRIITALGEVIARETPDMVLVQGDTTTTFASSLAAYYSMVSVGHVEAGLRTGKKYSPFPEEINRKLTSAIADIHFAPTQKNRQNLLAEGIPDEKIVVTGNTVIDALLWVRTKLRTHPSEYHTLQGIDFSKKIILVTGHRRENFGQDFINICTALKEIAFRNPDTEIVYPVHWNPKVRMYVRSTLSGIANVKLIDPLDYEPFVYLMNTSHFIISDSGGIQEEAPSLGKPVLVTRTTTERPEAVEVGAVKVVGTQKERIVDEAERLLYDTSHYATMSKVHNPYGDGHACARIIEGLVNFFS